MQTFYFYIKLKIRWSLAPGRKVQKDVEVVDNDDHDQEKERVGFKPSTKKKKKHFYFKVQF